MPTPSIRVLAGSVIVLSFTISCTGTVPPPQPRPATTAPRAGLGRFSGDGREIVYQRQGDQPGAFTIHIMDVDGANDREIPVLAGTQPQWLWLAPNGSRLAYVSMTPGPSGGPKIQLVTMRKDGRDGRIITDAGGFFAEWSPDSRSLLFADLPRGFAPGTMGVSLADADGSGKVQLSSGLPTPQSGAWSPDGTRIVFAAPNATGTALMIANRDGSGRRQLLSSPRQQGSPLWSRDGQRIAFFGGDSLATVPVALGLHLYVVNADGSGLTQVLANATGVSGISFSPDGRKLMFADRRSQRASDIFVIDADGRNERQLIDWPGTDELPVWSPDGKSILFQSSEDPHGRAPHLFIMRADGSGIRLLR